MKIKISAESSIADKPYAHLLPIVNMLLEKGNAPKTPQVFYNTQDGWRCDLKKPIDFKLIDKKFELPKTILLNKEKNIIWCKASWVEIQGLSG